MLCISSIKKYLHLQFSVKKPNDQTFSFCVCTGGDGKPLDQSTGRNKHADNSHMYPYKPFPRQHSPEESQQFVHFSSKPRKEKKKLRQTVYNA